VSCERAAEVQAYMDGELDAVAALAVEQHLETCADCKALRDQIAEMRSAIKSEARYYRPSTDFTERLREKIGMDEEPAAPRRMIGTRSFWSGVFGGAAATALAASFALFIWLPSAQQQLADDIAAAHVRSLIGTHLIDVESSNHHVVKPWFAGRADISPPVADFAAQGFTLAGARLDYVDGRRAAVLVYRHGAHVINVFVWKDDGSVRGGTADANGYHILSWRKGGLFFSAVSDTGADELRTLADLIRKNTPGQE
jgi:anti-sigma factor RsiW